MSNLFWLLLSLCCVPFTPVLGRRARCDPESPPTTTNGAIYMILVNIGRDTDRLLSTSSEAAETIELHAHRMEKMS